MRPPKYRENPELLQIPTVRCECRPDCKMQIGAMQHFVRVEQRGGASKIVHVEHLERFRDVAHHPEQLGGEAPGKVAQMRGRSTPMPPSDDEPGE